MKKGEANSKLESYLDKLDIEVSEIDSLERTMKYLRDISTSENTEFVEVFESNSIFFHYVHQLILQDVVLRIFKLIDRQTKRNIYWYLGQVRSNLNSFEQTNRFAQNELDNQIAKIENLECKLLNLINWRMNKFAHLKDRYYDNPSKLTEDFPLRFQDIKDSISVFKEIVEQHGSKLFNYATTWSENDIIEVDKVIGFLIERNRLFRGIEKKFGWNAVREMIENPHVVTEEN